LVSRWCIWYWKCGWGSLLFKLAVAIIHFTVDGYWTSEGLSLLFMLLLVLLFFLL
jgi:hypothetical protein